MLASLQVISSPVLITAVANNLEKIVGARGDGGDKRLVRVVEGKGENLDIFGRMVVSLHQGVSMSGLDGGANNQNSAMSKMVSSKEAPTS